MTTSIVINNPYRIPMLIEVCAAINREADGGDGVIHVRTGTAVRNAALAVDSGSALILVELMDGTFVSVHSPRAVIFLCFGSAAKACSAGGTWPAYTDR